MNVNKRAQLNRCLSVIAWKNTFFCYFPLSPCCYPNVFHTYIPTILTTIRIIVWVLLWSREITATDITIFLQFCAAATFVVSLLVWSVCLHASNAMHPLWRWFKKKKRQESIMHYKFYILRWLWFGLTADMQIILTLLWHVMSFVLMIVSVLFLG